jgi:hypothetical protein
MSNNPFSHFKGMLPQELVDALDETVDTGAAGVSPTNPDSTELVVVTYEQPDSQCLGDQIVVSFEHPLVSADTTLDFFLCTRDFELSGVSYVNETGLAQDNTNFFNIQVRRVGSILSQWSTNTDGAVVAGDFEAHNLSSTPGILEITAGVALSLHLDENGTQTLPAGRVVIEGAYYAKSPTLVEIFKPRGRFLVEQVRYVNPTGLAVHATNFFDIQVKNGATVVANWSTETGEEGALVADTHVDFTLSVVDGALVLEADDVLSVNLEENGTQTLPAGRFQIEGRYL